MKRPNESVPIRYWQVIAIAAFACAALFRFWDLGSASLDVDEYLHVLPAQQWIKQGRPLLPSGNEYTRAKLYTAATAGTFLLGPDTDGAARLPSAVTGLLTVAAVFAIGWRWFGAGSGAVAAALVACAPLAVTTSRLCRMYAWFELLYLLAVFVVWDRVWRQGLRLSRRAIGAVVVVFLLLLSAQLHSLTQVFVLAFALFLAGTALRHPKSAEAGWLFTGILAVVFAAVSGKLNLAATWERMNHVASWAAASRYHYDFYWKLWSKDFGALVWVAIPAVLWLIWRYRKQGWYLTAMAAAPLLLHSFILDWKAPRYVSYAVAPFLLCISPAIAAAIEWLADRIAKRSPVGAGLRFGAAAAVLALLLAVSWKQAWAVVLHPEAPAWRPALAFVQANSKPDDLLVASLPLAVERYLGGPADYIVDNYSAEDFQDRMKRNDEGLWVDWYSGSPFLTTEEEWLAAVSGRARGWCLISADRYASDTATPPAIRRWLETRAKRQEGVPPSVVVYRWGNSEF